MNLLTCENVFVSILLVGNGLFLIWERLDFYGNASLKAKMVKYAAIAPQWSEAERDIKIVEQGSTNNLKSYN